MTNHTRLTGLALILCVAGLNAGCTADVGNDGEAGIKFGWNISVYHTAKGTGETATASLDLQPLVNYVIDLQGDDVEGPPADGG